MIGKRKWESVVRGNGKGSLRSYQSFFIGLLVAVFAISGAFGTDKATGKGQSYILNFALNHQNNH